jgi:hypothetical protein
MEMPTLHCGWSQINSLLQFTPIIRLLEAFRYSSLQLERQLDRVQAPIC